MKALRVFSSKIASFPECFRSRIHGISEKTDCLSDLALSRALHFRIDDCSHQNQKESPFVKTQNWIEYWIKSIKFTKKTFIRMECVILSEIEFFFLQKVLLFLTLTMWILFSLFEFWERVVYLFRSVLVSVTNHPSWSIFSQIGLQ